MFFRAIKFKWIFFFIAALTRAPFANAADDIDAYASVAGTVINSFTDSEEGIRGGGKLEFARLSRWVSMDLRGAMGNHYQDYGAVLKIFKHWKFSEANATGISAGLGPLLLYSGGVDNGTFAKGTATRDGTKRPFMDIGVHPFVRFVYDTGRGFGFVADAGLDLITSRRYDTSPDDLSKKSSQSRTRLQGSLGIALPVD